MSLVKFGLLTWSSLHSVGYWMARSTIFTNWVAIIFLLWENVVSITRMLSCFPYGNKFCCLVFSWYRLMTAHSPKKTQVFHRTSTAAIIVALSLTILVLFRKYLWYLILHPSTCIFKLSIQNVNHHKLAIPLLSVTIC